jgi:hypothetical protein
LKAPPVSDLLTQDGNIRVLRIRNPWGKKEWQGDFAEKSDVWTSKLRTLMDRGKASFFVNVMLRDRFLNHLFLFSLFPFLTFTAHILLNTSRFLLFSLKSQFHSRFLFKSLTILPSFPYYQYKIQDFLFLNNFLTILGGKNDGTFWISYHDFLRRFCCVDVCKAHTEEGWTGVSHECYTKGDRKEGSKPGSHFDPTYVGNSVNKCEGSDVLISDCKNSTYISCGSYGNDIGTENGYEREIKCDIRNVQNCNSLSDINNSNKRNDKSNNCDYNTKNNSNNKNNGNSNNNNDGNSNNNNNDNINSDNKYSSSSNTINNNYKSRVSAIDINGINGDTSNNKNNITNINNEEINMKNTKNDYNHTVKNQIYPAPKKQNTPYCISTDSYFTLTVLDRTWLYVTLIQKSKRGKSKSVTDRTYWYSSLSFIIFEITEYSESVKYESRNNTKRTNVQNTSGDYETNFNNGENKKWQKFDENNHEKNDIIKSGKRLGNVVAYSFAGAVRDSPPVELQLPPGVCVHACV